MTILRTLYWFIAGGMIGFGLIAILSIGLPFILLGAVLLTLGALRFGGKEAFAALVGFGAMPAAILLWNVTSGPWACDTGVVTGGGSSASGPTDNTSYYSCVGTPFGTLTTYHILAAGFLLLALVGIALLVFANLRRQPQHPVAV